MSNEQGRVLARLWERLAKVREFSFTASNGPGSRTDWHGHGRGKVAVALEGGQLLFAETARFTAHEGAALELQNCYRWTLLEERLRLEQLRRRQPVGLLELQSVTANGFRQIEEHRSAGNRCSAELLLHKSEIELIWQIRGPRRNECLHYHYW